ncbi:transposase [Paraburkholderia sp. GAS333]
MTILELHRHGLSVLAIAVRLGMDLKTVRKYIKDGLQVPRNGPRAPRPCKIDPFVGYVTQRVQAFPELSIEHLLHEIKAMGYPGGRTAVGNLVRKVRPPRQRGFEVRFETPAGKLARVDFAHFNVDFEETPGQRRSIWLFSIVLGHSRYLWAQFVGHRDLQTVLRCHMEAFAHLGGVPHKILYDRMKTAVLGELERQVVYGAKMVAFGQHFNFTSHASKADRAKTKCKFEHPSHYIRRDFFLARRFQNLDDLNRQLRNWLDTVANVRVHDTTQRVVSQHFEEERAALQALPTGMFNRVVWLERLVFREGLVAVGRNYYSVPDGMRRHKLEVHRLAHELRIYEDGALLAVHPVLEGRRRAALLPSHSRAHHRHDCLTRT